MTLDEARLHKERWKTKNGQKTCKHMQVNDFLTVKNRRIREYLVCLVCGEVYRNPRNQLSRHNINQLGEL